MANHQMAQFQDCAPFPIFRFSIKGDTVYGFFNV